MTGRLPAGIHWDSSPPPEVIAEALLTHHGNKDTKLPMDSSSEKQEKARAVLKGKTKEELSRIKACCRMIRAQREVEKAKREVDAMDDDPAASDDSHRRP